MKNNGYTGKLKDSLFWWLGSKPFFVNDEYKIELLYIDRKYNSAKIRVTNLKNGDTNVSLTSQELSRDDIA